MTYRVRVIIGGKTILFATYETTGDAVRAAKSAVQGDLRMNLDQFDNGYLSAVEDLWSGKHEVFIPLRKGSVNIYPIA